jgi:FixJ family two-component response regulator
VAVVDDDQSVRESLPDLLKALGMVAHAFASAEAFLSSGIAATADCLILDIAMPGMSGVELYAQLRAQQQKVPVIFVTATTDDGLRQRLLDQGAVDCLFKPFTEAQLITALDSALRRR